MGSGPRASAERADRAPSGHTAAVALELLHISQETFQRLNDQFEHFTRSMCPLHVVGCLAPGLRRRILCVIVPLAIDGVLNQTT
jgi:hypothetical protein